MPLILRVDVDKPFGNSNFINSVRSKLSEDFYYPKWKLFRANYLEQLAQFLEHCNREGIKGHFYFRMCTIPDRRIVDLMKKGGHKAGVHAENTRSFENFKKEWDNLASKCELELFSFTKHGSGQLKLGKHHFPPYEPEKYRDWAMKMNVDFRFGNDLCTSPDDFIGDKAYYPKIFWIEREYRTKEFSSLDVVIESAKDNIVPILIHPSNYHSTKSVKEDFTELIALSKENGVDWVL